MKDNSILKSENGIALMLIIWIVTIMIVIVLSFSLTARTNAFSTLSFRESVKRDLALDAAVNHAIMELFYRIKNPPGSGLEDKDVWRVDGTEHVETFGDMEYAVRITDEEGKIDINKVDEILLKGMLSSLEIDDDEIDTIVDSILDWRDPDDLHRLHGAETEYYQSLPRPYHAKDADFDSLEELLLVKGVTGELLYGTEGKKGLIDFLTVYSKDTRININTAPKEVLTAIPGMGEDTIETIMTARQTEDTSIGMQPYVKNKSTRNIYTIEAAVRTGEKTSGYGIKAVVKIGKDNKFSILYWKTPSPITPL